MPEQEGNEPALSEIFERLDTLSDLIEENNKIAHETHRMVRDMRRTGRVSFWFKVIIWIIVLGVPLFFLGPILHYVETITGFSVPQSTSVFGIPSAQQLQDAVAQYKAKNAAPQ